MQLAKTCDDNMNIKRDNTMKPKPKPKPEPEHKRLARLMAAVLAMASTMPLAAQQSTAADAAQQAPDEAPTVQLYMTPAWQPPQDLENSFHFYVGEARVIKLPKPVVKTAVGNGKVLSVAIVSANELLMIANDAGRSTLHLWLGDGSEVSYAAEVAADSPAKIYAQVNREERSKFCQEQELIARTSPNKMKFALESAWCEEAMSKGIRGVSMDFRGYVINSQLHDKIITSCFFSDETHEFRFSAKGSINTSTVSMTGVSHITMCEFINGTICEGLYAWEVNDLDCMDNNFPSDVRDFWTALLSPYTKKSESQNNIIQSIVKKSKNSLLVYVRNIYGGDIAVICNDLSFEVNE
jgi:hypothetical protein